MTTGEALGETARPAEVVTPIAPHLHEVGRFIEPEEEAGFDPIGLVLRLMRGRWLAMIGTAIVFAGLFATAGWFATSPDYESRSIIRISAREPSILFSSGDDSRLKLFNAFVRGEATFVASRPVMERAAAIIAADLPAGAEAPSPLALSQSVGVQRKDALVIVTATGPDGPSAARRVNAVVRAYQALHAENESRRYGYRESELAARERSLYARLVEIDGRTLAVGGEYGATSLAKAHIAKVSQIEALETRRDEVRAALVSLEASGKDGDVDTGDDLIKRSILLDRGLADLNYDKARREAELAALLVRYQDKHKPVIAKRAEIAIVDEAIAARREQIVTLARTGALTDAEASDEQTVEEIRALLAKMEADLEEARTAARGLNEKRIELTFLEEERHEVRRMLDETRRALDVVRTESRNALPGIIEVMSDGAVPEAPADDMRLILAGAGGMAGAGFAAFLFLAAGFLSGRLRWSDDLGRVADRFRLVAVERHAGRRRRRSGEADAAAEAKTCANRLRNAIQLHPARRPVPAGRGRVVLVTAAAGAAPVRQSLALAESFSRSGLDTLVVDADLADRALTEATGTAGAPGFREAVASAARPVAPVVTETGLKVLPGGDGGVVDAGSVSLPAVRAALSELSRRHEVVIVHGGGAPNALLRELVASESDLAVVVAMRGEARAAVERTARRMDDLSRNGTVLLFADARRGDPALST